MLSTAGFFCHRTAKEGLSRAGVSLEYNAAAVIDESAAGQIGDNAPVERAFIHVQDVMDIRFWKTKLCVLDQSLHFLIVFPLIDAVCQQLKPVIKGKCQRLRILLLYFKLLYEFTDIQKADLSPGLIIQHREHLPSDSSHCLEGIPWRDHRKRIRIPDTLYK